jgi:RES domain-containing protein
LALATVEMLAKVRVFEGLRGRVAVCADVPDDAVQVAKSLPPDWKQFPHPGSTRGYGNKWYDEAASLALIVPSVVVAGQNVLLNPTHPRAGEIVVSKPITDPFDARLLG